MVLLVVVVVQFPSRTSSSDWLASCQLVSLPTRSRSGTRSPWVLPRHWRGRGRADFSRTLASSSTWSSRLLSARTPPRSRPSSLPPIFMRRRTSPWRCDCPLQQGSQNLCKEASWHHRCAASLRTKVYKILTPSLQSRKPTAWLPREGPKARGASCDQKATAPVM